MILKKSVCTPFHSIPDFIDSRLRWLRATLRLPYYLLGDVSHNSCNLPTQTMRINIQSSISLLLQEFEGVIIFFLYSFVKQQLGLLTCRRYFLQEPNSFTYHT